MRRAVVDEQDGLLFQVQRAEMGPDPRHELVLEPLLEDLERDPGIGRMDVAHRQGRLVDVAHLGGGVDLEAGGPGCVVDDEEGQAVPGCGVGAEEERDRLLGRAENGQLAEVEAALVRVVDLVGRVAQRVEVGDEGVELGQVGVHPGGLVAQRDLVALAELVDVAVGGLEGLVGVGVEVLEEVQGLGGEEGVGEGVVAGALLVDPEAQGFVEEGEVGRLEGLAGEAEEVVLAVLDELLVAVLADVADGGEADVVLFGQVDYADARFELFENLDFLDEVEDDLFALGLRAFLDYFGVLANFFDYRCVHTEPSSCSLAKD